VLSRLEAVLWGCRRWQRSAAAQDVWFIELMCKLCLLAELLRPSAAGVMTREDRGTFSRNTVVIRSSPAS
jgi:hypothetical protein